MANVWKHVNNGQSHKTIEWVKLIDYEYSQNMVKVWLGLIQRSVMKKSSENQGLKVQVSNLKRGEDVCTTSQSFWKQCVKKFGIKRVRIVECKTS